MITDPSSRPRVRLLDPHTINQIAAGEVVERPAAVVKELVENSIDAGSTAIEVEITDAGRGRIRVADNGCGMDAEDLQSAMQRHATSKIVRLEDLQQAETLGFRGEAIPSIASVSRMRVSTGLGDGVRYTLDSEGGANEPIRTESGPRGTTITVEDLFYNTPARLRFLKTDATEMAQCVEVVSRLAMAHPTIRFTVRTGNGLVLQTSGQGDLLSTIIDIWGLEIARALAELDHYENGVRVRGFISPPHATKPSRNYQWLSVNSRPVRSRGLQTAVDVAYRSLTPERRYPIAVLMVDIDPSKVDMNVSPTKSDCKFASEPTVFDAVRHAIRHALLQHGMIPDAAGLARANEALASLHAQSPLGWLPTDVPLAAMPIDQMPLMQVEATSQPAPEGGAYRSLLDGVRVIGQLMNTFIIAENAQGMLIIDQHVAHERILYEWLIRERGKAGLEIQPLLTPETIHVNRMRSALIQERLDDLKALGFDLEPFGDEAFLVRTVPGVLRGKSGMKVLRDVIDEMVDGDGGGCLSPTRNDLWIMCSCKMAVKAGDPLSMAEMEKLIFDLAETENPYLCPHGRPITIVMAKTELLRKFKR